MSPNEDLVETNNDCDTTSFYSVNDTYAMSTANETEKIHEVCDQTFETKPLSGENFSDKNMAKLELENARLKAEIQRLSSREQLSLNFPSENSSDTDLKSLGLENGQTTMVSDRRVNKIRRKRSNKSVRFFDSPVSNLIEGSKLFERISEEETFENSLCVEINTPSTPTSSVNIRKNSFKMCNDTNTSNELDHILSSMQVDCFDIKALTNLLKEQSVQESFNSPRLQDFTSKQTPDKENITEKDDPISNDLIRQCYNTDVREIDKEKNERLCQIEELMKRVEAFEIEKSTHLSQIDNLKDTLQNEVDRRKTLENKLDAKEEYTQEENTGLIETRVSDESVNQQIQTNDELRQENDHLNEVINKLRQDLNNLNNEKKYSHEENSGLIKDKA